ncbi:MAG: hypothetical protein V3T31_12420, partial [candidate division Zixibacteria bacterium]
VADNLTEGGLYIIEMNHPRDIFGDDKSAQNKWEMERDGIKVLTHWGSEVECDPLTEIDTLKVDFTVTSEGNSKEYSSVDQSRQMPLGLIRALLNLSGRLKIAAMFGDLNISVPFDNDKKAWRMVLVLKKF